MIRRRFSRITFLAVFIVALGLFSFSSGSIAQENEARPILETLTDLPAATGGVAVSPEGNIFVADIDTAAIYRVTPEGEVSLFVEDPQLQSASGNTFDTDGNLYQSSLRNSQIMKISPEGELEVFANSSIGLRNPVGIFIDDDGLFYVANCGGANVIVINPDGTLERVIRSFLFSCPNGISMDEEKNIYVANFNNGNVLKIDAETDQVDFFATLPGNNNGHILWADGFFYVASRGGAQLFTLSLDGELELFAGTGERGHVDGPLPDVQISLPNDLGFSPDGSILYFNDAQPTTGSENQPSFLKRILLNPEEN